MVFGFSPKTVVSVLALAGVVVAFISLGGAGGIGSRIGKGLSDFGNSIIGGITGIGTGAQDFFTNPSEENIITELGIENKFVNIPTDLRIGELSGLSRGLITFGEFLNIRGLKGKIDFADSSFVNQVTRQPLGFTITPTGDIRTGRIGLSDGVLQRQAQLSMEFGIPTFDIKGNLSTFGGSITGK